ncbi:MAG: DUF5318 family protein [Geodermatophilaceae bacterium]|nr:DUF5318 family protein [Geodermatophilaceae bacterium]
MQAGERREGSAEARQRRAVVDYALQRRAKLAEVYAGRASLHDVCDAHPYLLRAAKFHGQPADASCPVCRKEQLTEVHYVYGESLKAVSGQAKSPPELTDLAQRFREFSVYVVEVCRSCGWNHLTRSFVMGRSSATASRRRAATE